METLKSTVGIQKRPVAISLKLVAEVLGRVAQFGTFGLVAHTLSLADFGVYGLALVLGFLLAQVADFGLHLLVTRQLGRSYGAALATKLWLLSGLLVLTIGSVILTSYGWAFGLLIISSLLYSLAELSFAVLRTRNQLHYEAGLVILYRLALLGGALVVFFTNAGLSGVALIYFGAGGLVAAVGLRISQVRPVGTFDPQLLRKAAPIGVAIMLSLLAFKIDVPLLQIITGNSAEVGLYNAAYQLFEPLLLFPAALLAGFFPVLAKAAYQPTLFNFTHQTRKLLAVLAGGGVIAGGDVALVAGWVVPLLFGTGYDGASLTLGLLAVAVPFLFVNSGLTHALLALDCERIYLYFFGVCLSLNVAANLILIPSWGRNGAAVATIVTEVALTAMCGVALQLTLKPKNLTCRHATKFPP